MVIVKIMGGIASQLHKYAVGRAVALKYSMPLLLDLSSFESTPEGDTPWEFRLNEFAIKAEIANSDQIKRLKGSNKLFRVRNALLHRFGIDFHKKSCIVRAPWDLPRREDVKRGVYLAGEWGGDQYFADIKSVLVDEFKPSGPLSDVAKSYLDEIINSTSVSVHVRRGDYVSNAHAAKFHSLCDEKYYDSAIGLITSRVQSPRFFLFSDDKPAAMEMIGKGMAVTLIEGVSDVEEFYLMSQCRHNICANSGFSYLAAWLGTADDEIVISPKNWLKDPLLNSRLLESIYCDKWIYLDN